MKIGIDMDDVLAELVREMVGFHNRVYKTQLMFEDHLTYDLTKIWSCTNDEVIKRVYEFYDSPEMDLITPPFGTYESLKALRQSHDLVIITSRPHFMEAKSKSWLKKHFPELDLDVHFTNQFSPEIEKRVTKAEVCQNLGVGLMIDDAPHYVLNCAQNGIRTLLFDRPWNKTFPRTKNVSRVKSWREIVKKIKCLGKKD